MLKLLWAILRSALNKGTLLQAFLFKDELTRKVYRFGKKHYPILISAASVPELNQLSFLDGGIEVGSALPLTDLWEALENTTKYLTNNDQGKDAYKTRRLVTLSCFLLYISNTFRCVYSLQAITHQLQWFSGTSIRNGACLGGNIVTASPISDLNPVFVALNAQFRLKSVEGERVVPASEFFMPAYRKVDIKHDEVITTVTIPYTQPNQYVEAYKQARRREDDIAIVNAGFNVSLDDSVSINTCCWHLIHHSSFSFTNVLQGRVTAARLAFGGLAPYTMQAKQTQEFLVGKQWNQDTFEKAVDILKEEVALKDGTPGGMEKYRTTLALSFFFKYYLSVAQKMVPHRVSMCLHTVHLCIPYSPMVRTLLLRTFRPCGHSTQILPRVGSSLIPAAISPWLVR